MGRFTDQVLAPLRDDRRDADRLTASLRAMAAPSVGVDVNPLTQQLQRRLQQRSILYLMGPQRMLDRVRQAPGLLARLPRFAWDYVTKGEVSAATLNAGGNGQERQVPDFRAILADQFAVLQSRIDDALRSTPAGERWLTDDAQRLRRPPSSPRTPPPPSPTRNWPTSSSGSSSAGTPRPRHQGPPDAPQIPARRVQAREVDRGRPLPAHDRPRHPRRRLRPPRPHRPRRLRPGDLANGATEQRGHRPHPHDQHPHRRPLRQDRPRPDRTGLRLAGPAAPRRRRCWSSWSGRPRKCRRKR